MPKAKTICEALGALSQALIAWAEGERLNTLENEFIQAEMDGEE